MLREELLLKKRPVATVAVPTPEWPEQDGQIFVRKITAAELDAYYNEASELSERARFACLCACDGAGAAIFKTTDAADVAEMESAVIDRIAYAGQHFNGLLAAQREVWQKSFPIAGLGGSQST